MIETYYLGNGIIIDVDDSEEIEKLKQNLVSKDG